MVIGTGIDIIEVSRVKSAVARQSFAERVFTEAEREYIEEHGGSAETAAGMFAAKEAVAKALALGFNGIGWHDIEIHHDENGKPWAEISGGAKARMEELSAHRLHLSISHIKELAVAQAILED